MATETQGADWRTMEPGPALNASVCEALGITPRLEYFASHDGGKSGMFFSDFRGEVEQFIADYRERLPESVAARCEVVEFKRYPPVSEEMGAAWWVVERMRGRPAVRWRNLSLVAYCYARTYATFDADAFLDYAPETWAEANGEHATPLAICRAALMAVEASAEG